MKSTNNRNRHGSSKGPSSSLSLCLTSGLQLQPAARQTSSAASQKRPNRNIGRLNLMILSIWERSDSYVCILFNPGCCQSQQVMQVCVDLEPVFSYRPTRFVKSDKRQRLAGLTGAVVTNGEGVAAEGHGQKFD